MLVQSKSLLQVETYSVDGTYTLYLQ